MNVQSFGKRISKIQPFLMALIWFLILVSGCKDSSSVVGPNDSIEQLDCPSFLEVDETNSSFIFLPPLANEMNVKGDFEPRFISDLRVEICALKDGACSGDPIGVFSEKETPDNQSIVVNNDEEYFIVNWDTSQNNIKSSEEYRITVYVREIMLGFQDVIIVERSSDVENSELKSTTCIPTGHIVPIRFHVEQGIPGASVIDSEGGYLKSKNGFFTLTIPEGSVSEDVVITVEELVDYTPVRGLLPATFRTAPEGLEFQNPAQLAIQYNPDSVPAGVREESLGLVKLIGGEWSRITESGADINSRTVTGHVPGFSEFGVRGVDCSLDEQYLSWPVFPRDIITQAHGQFSDVSRWSENDPGPRWRHHAGIDFAAPIGEAVEAAGSGCVVSIQENNNIEPGRDRGYGNTVIIEHIHGDFIFYTHYSHLDNISIELEQKCRANDESLNIAASINCYNVPVLVTRNTVLGTIGGTGFGESDSWAPHLHFEVKEFKELVPTNNEVAYTYDHPDESGYFDPVLWFIDPYPARDALDIKWIRATDEGVEHNVRIRVGPQADRYRYLRDPVSGEARTLKSGEEFLAIRKAPAQTGVCNAGWYQIVKDEKVLGDNGGLLALTDQYISDLRDVETKLPTAWVCAGNGDVNWVVEIDSPDDPPTAWSEIPISELKALQSLYETTDGDNWDNNEGWFDEHVSPSEWFGVVVEEGHVVRLVMPNNGLTGELPSSLINLKELNMIWLHSNNLSGKLSTSLGELIKLQEIGLWNNNLSGEIPSELGKLNNLIQLILHFNNLSGDLPSELGQLENLETLWLNNNEELVGPIPNSFMQFTLRIFNFEETQLCEPPDVEFQNWLNGIPDLTSTGIVCNDSEVVLPPTITKESPILVTGSNDP